MFPLLHYKVFTCGVLRTLVFQAAVGGDEGQVGPAGRRKGRMHPSNKPSEVPVRTPRGGSSSRPKPTGGRGHTDRSDAVGMSLRQKVESNELVKAKDLSFV